VTLKSDQYEFVALVQNRRPYLPFCDRHLLPDVPALYIVLDDYSTLLYIGIAVNLRLRWTDHHRAPQMHWYYRIYWRATESASERVRHERAFIKAYRPLWNGTKQPCGSAAALSEEWM
jgi:excinuclease UvrABC nuclease subunit